MENSILTSTKQILGLPDADDAYDLDVLTHINAAFATLSDLGVDPIYIDDASSEWGHLDLHPDLLAMVRPYVVLRTQMAWDPPVLSFLIDLKKSQIAEYEWRINSFLDRKETA